MTKQEAINHLEELIMPFERSIDEAKIGDEYAIEALEDNEKSVEALKMAITALRGGDGLRKKMIRGMRK